MSITLYNDVYCLGVRELEKIYLSLLTTADQIYINANVTVNPSLPPDIYAHINDSLKTLEKNGLIVYWTFPYDVCDKDRIIQISSSEYEMWNDIINETFFNSERLDSIFSYLGKPTQQLSIAEEKTSKILLIRKEYWTYALLTLLKADKVLNYYQGWLPDEQRINALNTERIEDKIIHKVFQIDSPDLYRFDGEDISYLHKKNKKKRDQLNMQIRDNLFCDQKSMLGDMLSEAIQNCEVRIKLEENKRTSFYQNAGLEIAGFTLNSSPAGIIYGQLKNAWTNGSAIYDFVKDLLGSDNQNITYLISTMKRRVNKYYNNNIAI